jgi:hypothetical protein
MTCCGNVIEITTQDDRTPVHMCQECGKQGPPSAFPDEPLPDEPESFVDRVRWWFAELFADLAARVAPK